MSLPQIIVVTGTDTDVGKTVVTAAVAALLVGAGRTVAAYKPTQTGVAPGDPADMAEVTRLSGVAGHDGVRLGDPMAPRPAAAREDAVLPGLAHHLTAVAALAATHDHVLVEGAGGLLVELTEDADTIADLALALGVHGLETGVLTVARSGLGTLNHTMLTREALRRRGIREIGIVIGSWPDEPDMIEESNWAYFSELDDGLLGAVPSGAPARDASSFAALAPGWLPGLAAMLGQRRGTP
ncbi:MAG: dethiobiotin synthase [Terracoccus sp.]